MPKRELPQLDLWAVFWGALLGFVVGAYAGLFHAPQRDNDRRSQRTIGQNDS